jgi:hypothetical protein
MIYLFIVSFFALATIFIIEGTNAKSQELKPLFGMQCGAGHPSILWDVENSNFAWGCWGMG